MEKLEISIVKREAAGKFVVEMFSGEIFDKAVYQVTLEKKTSVCQKKILKVLLQNEDHAFHQIFYSLITELRVLKKVCHYFVLFERRRLNLIGMVVNSFGVAICPVA